MRVKPVSLIRLIGSMHAIPVQCAGTRFRQVAMPYLVRAFTNRYALYFPPPAIVEQTELDFLSVLGEQREIDAASIPSGPERKRPARPRRRHRLHQRFFHGRISASSPCTGIGIQSGRLSSSYRISYRAFSNTINSVSALRLSCRHGMYTKRRVVSVA